MNYFREIIFPPIPKADPVAIVEEQQSFGSLLDLRYWFEYSLEFTKFMVRCPTCGEIYCYSRLGKTTRPDDIAMGIKENSKFFVNEWISNCPKIKDHTTILDSLRGLI